MLQFQEHSWADSRREAAREELAKIVNASTAEIGLGEGATYGLLTFARLLSRELRSGDNIVTTDMEYVGSAIPWLDVARQIGVELRAAKHRNGIYEMSDFEKVIDGKTRVLVVSSVEWNNGFKNDLEALGKIAEEGDIYFVVDAAQHVGAAEFDTAKLKVDFMAASGHKWLVSPFGCGFFYMSKRMVDSFDPDVIGHQNTKPGQFATTIQYFESPEANPLVPFIPNKTMAKKFEVGGTANYPGALALAASLRLMNGIGIENIAKRDLELGDYLIAGLQRLRVNIQSPIDHEHRAGITTFRLCKTPAEEKEFVTFLRQKKIFTTLRFTAGVGGTRVSTHFYNNEADIDILLGAIKDYANSHSGSLMPETRR